MPTKRTTKRTVTRQDLETRVKELERLVLKPEKDCLGWFTFGEVIQESLYERLNKVDRELGELKGLLNIRRTYKVDKLEIVPPTKQTWGRWLRQRWCRSGGDEDDD